MAEFATMYALGLFGGRTTANTPTGQYQETSDIVLTATLHINASPGAVQAGSGFKIEKQRNNLSIIHHLLLRHRQTNTPRRCHPLRSHLRLLHRILWLHQNVRTLQHTQLSRTCRNTGITNMDG